MMNLILIQQVVGELSPLLSGSRISKVYQPGAELIILKLWTGTRTLKLLLSAEADLGRIHLTTADFLNPSQPPRFCQLLRSRLSRIETIEMVNDDRIVRLRGAGEKGPCALILQLTGRFGQMFLVNGGGTIIDLLRRDENNRLNPGDVYTVPEKTAYIEKRAPLEIPSDPPGGSWNIHVENLYSEKNPSSAKNSPAGRLRRLLRGQQKKLLKRRQKIEQDLVRQHKAEELKQYGELILNHLHQLRRGSDQLTVENYYTEAFETVTIELDPRLSPQDNAAAYFQRYKKAKRGVEHSRRRMGETEEELDWVDQLLFQLEDLDDPADLEELAEELRRAGLLRENSSLQKRRTRTPSQPHEALSPGGFKVIWGRNNRQNDEISTRILKKGDLWFHAHNAPGAHVVLQAAGSRKIVTDADLEYAAGIAAGYSKLRHDAKVEVIKAPAGAVKKPKGAKPGLVTVGSYTTLRVVPQRPAIRP